MCLNLYDSQFKCLQDSGYYADAFPQSDISVVMCSRQSSLPAKCFLWKNVGKWRPGSARQSFQGLVLSSQRVDTLTKRGLLCGVGPLVSQNQGLLRLPDSPDNSLLWFLPSMFQYQISIERDLGVMKICTAKVFIQGSLLDTFIGLPSSMALPWFWNLALPFINQMTLAKSFNLFEL